MVKTAWVLLKEQHWWRGSLLISLFSGHVKAWTELLRGRGLLAARLHSSPTEGPWVDALSPLDLNQSRTCLSNGSPVSSLTTMLPELFIFIQERRKRVRFNSQNKMSFVEHTQIEITISWSLQNRNAQNLPNRKLLQNANFKKPSVYLFRHLRFFCKNEIGNFKKKRKNLYFETEHYTCIYKERIQNTKWDKCFYLHLLQWKGKRKTHQSAK